MENKTEATRTKNTSSNLIFALILQAFLLIAGLIFPRFIIHQFGDEVNGLTATINRVLAIVALLQSGAVGASIFTLYKPVADKDYITVGKVVHSSQRYFTIIGILYLAISAGVAIFYGFYLQSSEISALEIILAFSALIINGASYIFVASIFDLFFSAFQKRFYLSIGDLISYVVYYICVVFILVFKLHFLLLFFSHILGAAAKVIFLYVIYRLKYKDKIVKVTDKKEKFPIKNRGYLMASSIGEQSVGAAPTVIVSSVLGLAASSVFSIYSMVYLAIKAILSQMDYAISPVFGNLVVTSDEKKISDTFNVLQLLFFGVGAILSACIGFLIMPFIGLYTKGITDISYVYPLLGIFVTVYIAIFTVRQSYAYIAEVYGFFKSMFKITLIFAAIGIVVSTVLTIAFKSVAYVMVGVLLYQTLNTIFTIVVLKKRLKWFSLKRAIPRFIFLFIATALPITLSFVLNVEVSSWLWWIIWGFIIFGSTSVYLLIYSFIFERKEIKKLFGYAKGLLHRRRK